jgi:hypothetical protein
MDEEVINERPHFNNSTVLANQIESVAQIWVVACLGERSLPAIDLRVTLKFFEPRLQHSHKR